MDFSQEIQDFLSGPHFMVLGTIRRSGQPQMTLVWYEYENGVFRVSTTTDRAKYYNVKRDPRVTAVVFDEENPYRYIQVFAEVSEMTKEGGHDFIDRLSQHYLGQETYPYDPQRQEDRITLTITPQSHVSVGFD